MNALTKKRLTAKLCSMSTIIIVVLVFMVFAIATATTGINFLKPSNLSTIMNQASPLVVLGIGQALVILTGGIDLSVGALMAFTTVVWGGFLILAILTRYVSLGSVWAGGSFPFISWYCYPDPVIVALAFVIGGLVVWQHRGNIVRLIHGNENKFSFHHKKEGTP